MFFYVNTSAKPHKRVRSNLTTTVKPCEEDIANDSLPAAQMGVVPNVEYNYKSVVGSGYIGAPVAENYRLRVRLVLGADGVVCQSQHHQITNKLNQYRHERRCTEADAPGHVSNAKK
uniref:Uncharacterized protein n=1 Tax=Tetranychus urticae TaxID=32264 RepID=T1KJD0_TETUR